MSPAEGGEGGPWAPQRETDVQGGRDAGDKLGRAGGGTRSSAAPVGSSCHGRPRVPSASSTHLPLTDVFLSFSFSCCSSGKT